VSNKGGVFSMQNNGEARLTAEKWGSPEEVGTKNVTIAGHGHVVFIQRGWCLQMYKRVEV